MLPIEIPGYCTLELRHLVLDYNGTLAVDGRLLDGIEAQLAALAQTVDLHIVTGNTYGDARERLHGCPAEVVCLPARGQAQIKREYVLRLGAQQVVAVGNGRNDALMLEQAALGIAVVGTEGLAGDALKAADVVVHHATDALGLLLHPKRLIATLRS